MGAIWCNILNEMSKRIKVEIGDIFEVELIDNKKGYLQFISLDTSQLNSEVVRVFEKRYDKSTKPSLEEIVSSEVQFYTHVIVKDGVKEKIWSKYGRLPLANNFEYPYFRSSGDYGNPKVKKSIDWYIWQVNKETKHVGRLNEEQKKYDLGPVILPYLIKEMMMTKELSFFYPSY